MRYNVYLGIRFLLMNVSKEGLQCVSIVPVVVLTLIITVDGLKALRAKKS